MVLRRRLSQIAALPQRIRGGKSNVASVGEHAQKRLPLGAALWLSPPSLLPHTPSARFSSPLDRKGSFHTTVLCHLARFPKNLTRSDSRAGTKVPWTSFVGLEPALDRSNQVGYGSAHHLGAYRFDARTCNVGRPIPLGDGLVCCLLHHLRRVWQAQGEAEHHGY